MHPSLSRRKFLALSGTAAAAALATGGLRPPLARACPVPEVDSPDTVKDLAKGINAFACDLHGRLARDEKGSLFFSPFSIEAALAMTAAGARGVTLAEMTKTLHLPEDPHAAFGDLIGHLNSAGRDRQRPYELTVANAIWAMTGFPWRKEFTDLTRKHYGAGVVETDFGKPEAARRQINAWVEKETRQKIKELIPDGVLDPLTRMVLTNAIYFKGTWQYTFDKTHTADSPFTRADGTKADVPLMHQTGTFNYGEFKMFVFRRGERVQVLELPYSGRELSMLVYLPDSPGSADRLARWLTADHFAKPDVVERKVEVHLPRFKAETSYSLQASLVDLGMKAAFVAADFRGMHTGDEHLFISHVLHKAFVDVNEEGTEAAAATAVVVKERENAPREAVFRADRPFVFVVRDNKTGTALFVGRYSGPAK